MLFFDSSLSEQRLKWLYEKEDNHLLIFCVFSRDSSSDISQLQGRGAGAAPVPSGAAPI
jgi:hypothetical protein